jgi:hypothetical protein
LTDNEEQNLFFKSGGCIPKGGKTDVRSAFAGYRTPIYPRGVFGAAENRPDPAGNNPLPGK